VAGRVLVALEPRVELGARRVGKQVRRIGDPARGRRRDRRLSGARDADADERDQRDRRERETAQHGYLT
jgi:hypothetical protein